VLVRPARLKGPAPPDQQGGSRREQGRDRQRKDEVHPRTWPRGHAAQVRAPARKLLGPGKVGQLLELRQSAAPPADRQITIARTQGARSPHAKPRWRLIGSWVSSRPALRPNSSPMPRSRNIGRDERGRRRAPRAFWLSSTVAAWPAVAIVAEREPAASPRLPVRPSRCTRPRVCASAGPQWHSVQSRQAQGNAGLRLGSDPRDFP